jgi:predicted CoA-binding protein
MDTAKTTLVIGASEKSERYSNMAIKLLRSNHIETVAIGSKVGVVGDVPILVGQPRLENIDTVTLYLNPTRQKPFYDYILSLRPRRIIFNPGTENEELVALANSYGIESMDACTLVLLKTGNY